jgi:O-antigen/teichoic acid export membrane protein
MKSEIDTNIPLLASNSFHYTIGLIVSNVITFLNLPLLARGLSNAEFGIYDFFSSITILITILAAFGIDSSVGRFFHEYNDEEEKRKIIFESFIIQLLFIILISLILYLNAEYIINLFTNDVNLAILFKLTIVQAAFQTILNFVLSLLKWSFEKWKFIALTIFSSALNLLMTSIAIHNNNFEISDIFVAIIISRVLSAILSIYMIKKWLVIKKINFIYYTNLIKYAFPIGIVCLIEVFVPLFERNSILGIINAEQLGLYAASAKLVSILSVFVQAFQTAWGPLSISIKNEKEALVTYLLAAKTFAFIMSLSVLFIVYFGKPAISIILSERYAEAYKLIFPMALSIAIYSTGLILETGIYISKKTIFQIYIFLIYAFTVLVILPFLTKEYGLMGAAYAILISNLVRTLTASILGQYAFLIKWPYREVYITLLFTFTIGLIFTLIQFNYGILLQVGTAIVSLLSIIYLFWNFLLKKYEREILIKLCRIQLRE